MTTLNTIIEEEKKEFKKRFTTYGHGYHLNDRIPPEEAYDFLTTAMQRAYEAGREELLELEKGV